MDQKILFAIIPKWYFITLLISILFLFIGGGYIELSNLGFNLVIFLIGVKLAVFVHELGHLLFAKLVGGTPRRVILGRSHEVTRTEINGINIILNSNFNSGFAYAAFDNLNAIRLKLMVFTSGGVIVNILIAAVLLLTSNISTEFTDKIQWSTTIGFANLITGLSALIPYRSIYQGRRIYSDGLSILRIPFHKKEALLELTHANQLLDAYDLFEAKEYMSSIKVYEEFKKKTNGSQAADFNIGIAYMKLGDHSKAIEYLEGLTPLIDQEPFIRYQGFIYNGLAWLYLIENRLEEANKYSELAFKIDPNSEPFRGTRASVLIEQGQFEEGKSLIISDVDFKFPNSQTLSAAIYIGLAFSMMNQPKKARDYFKFVETNFEELDTDEKLLFHRAQEKIAIHNSH